MKKILRPFIVISALSLLAGCESVPKESVPEEETPTHQHSLEYHPAGSASFFNEGSEVDYYYCSGCNKSFDSNGNEINPKLTPRLSPALSIGVNGEIKGDFTVDESELEFDHLFWKYENLSLEKDDVISVHSKNDSTITYDYFPDTQTNITEEHKVHNDVSNATISISGTPNGLYLAISGFVYDGIVIKINDTEYPMSHALYYDENIETNIYGYVYIGVNDKVVIIDKDNDITYDYDDLEDYTKWNLFDFHSDENKEIVFDYEARYGFEFDRGGDKKIGITKAFGPNDTNEVAVQFSSERSNEALTNYEIPKTSPEYEEMLWYINHESVFNNFDITSYVENFGLHVFSGILNFEENEMFNILDITNSSSITGDHLAEVHSSTLIGAFSIEGNYIKALKSGRYSVVYMPAVSSIALYEMSSSTVDAYILFGGNFIELTKDENNEVHYEFEVTTTYGETFSLLSGNYSALNITFDASVDLTCIKSNGNGMSHLPTIQ